MVNKKYHFLDDHAGLFEQLKLKTMFRYAKEISKDQGLDARTIFGCIRFIVNRYFTEDQIKQIKKGNTFKKKKAV